MKNASLYIDLAFCLGFLPLMIFAFPVERWWGTYPAVSYTHLTLPTILRV